MKIGIDISQLAYEKTGVANYLKGLLINMLEIDKENEYILFFSSFRGKLNQSLIDELTGPRVSFKFYKYPPAFLDILWNRLHILPIENLIGDIDIFITSDWTEPPVKRAKKMTILYDLIVYKLAEETAKKIVKTQKRKLHWVQKESDTIICISNATKEDARDILHIDENRLKVVYPGI